METGTVKWFNDAKGFGFITRESGSDVFVHFGDIRTAASSRWPKASRCSSTLSNSPKGAKAANVVKL